MRMYNPNIYFYSNDGGREYIFWDKGSNKKLAEFGYRNNLSCGGAWIIGKDFAFQINYAADSYNHMSSVREFNAENTEKWHELRRYLCEVEWNLHSLKSRDNVANDLGLIEKPPESEDAEGLGD